MIKRFLQITVLTASVALVSSSCSKEGEEQANNPMNGRTTVEFNSEVTYGSMTDLDGNIYKTVTIGTQTWMAENLRTTKYNDGTDIPLVTDNSSWIALTTGAYCCFDNTTDLDTIATFGRLYNWYAVNTDKLAPEGWHVPTDAEWTQLTDYLGGTSAAGGLLKEAGTTHWLSPNKNATNETGFSAIPAGPRDSQGDFDSCGYDGFWWCTTEQDGSTARYRNLYYATGNVYSYYLKKEIGISVRCVKD